MGHQTQRHTEIAKLVEKRIRVRQANLECQQGGGHWLGQARPSYSLQCQAFRLGLQVGQTKAIQITRNHIIHLC